MKKPDAKPTIDSGYEWDRSYPPGGGEFHPPLADDRDKMVGPGLILDAPNEWPGAQEIEYADLGPEYRYDENDHFDDGSETGPFEQEDDDLLEGAAMHLVGDPLPEGRQLSLRAGERAEHLIQILEAMRAGDAVSLNEAVTITRLEGTERVARFDIATPEGHAKVAGVRRAMAGGLKAVRSGGTTQ